jgi:adapter protein MecA 1/2
MRVERLGGDKIRFFLTLDDLADRGIEKEDIWRDIPKVHELFNDMMEHAYQELGFEVTGPVAVEVFALPAQGMVVVVTRGQAPGDMAEEISQDPEIYELEVTMEETKDLVFCFHDFENLVQAAHRVKHLIQGGQVYAFQNRYYLLFGQEMQSDDLETLVAILSEFGEMSTCTIPYLQEYGKVVFEDHAVQQISHYFG